MPHLATWKWVERSTEWPANCTAQSTWLADAAGAPRPSEQSPYPTHSWRTGWSTESVA